VSIVLPSKWWLNYWYILPSRCRRAYGRSGNGLLSYLFSLHQLGMLVSIHTFVLISIGSMTESQMIHLLACADNLALIAPFWMAYALLNVRRPIEQIWHNTKETAWRLGYTLITPKSLTTLVRFVYSRQFLSLSLWVLYKLNAHKLTLYTP